VHRQRTIGNQVDAGQKPATAIFREVNDAG
jgi:hypothetical protein